MLATFPHSLRTPNPSPRFPFVAPFSPFFLPASSLHRQHSSWLRFCPPLLLSQAPAAAAISSGDCWRAATANVKWRLLAEASISPLATSVAVAESLVILPSPPLEEESFVVVIRHRECQAFAVDTDFHWVLCCGH